MSNHDNFKLIKTFIEDESKTKMSMLDSEDASEKGISVEKLKAQRAKLLAKNKKMLSTSYVC